ncbi:MAG TPA: hypothetical protein VLT33_18715 [Labilithrix sp.]|nr:hypothetical protein [Labilithrix sp.]
MITGALVLATASCKKDTTAKPTEIADDPALLAEDGTDSAAAETDTEVLTSSLVSATAAGGSLSLASTDLTGGELGTKGVGDGAKAIYFPKGCLEVTGDEAAKTVTYVFTGCAGPNGIFRLTGTLVATYALSPGKLVLDMVGNDLTVNRSKVDWAAHAEITGDGAARQMAWKGTLSGTTARGKDFSRTNDKVVAWRFGERCFAVSGVSEGNVRGRYLRTEIADFKRCQGSCPEAGGRITITNAQAKVKVEILFDGTSRASYTTPKGTTTFDLACNG